MRARVLLLTVCCLAAVAHADPVAEQLFQDGRAALTAGKLEEACELFRRSDAIEPRVGTIANLAECEERRGRIATAWAAFFDTKARATAGDPKAVYATKHIAALEPRLPYLTIVVPSSVRMLAATVHRNGTLVGPAELDRKLPFDPGPYRIEVAAAGYATWHAEVTLVEGKETRVEVPLLVASAAPPRPADPAHEVVAPAPVEPPIAMSMKPDASAAAYHVGLGLLLGLSSDLDTTYGGRVVLNAAPLGPGVVRVVPAIMYRSGADPADVYRTYTLYAVSTTFEYAYAVNQRLIAAGGLGVGLDLKDDSYGNSYKNGWGCVRLSPTVRFDRFDVAAHVQVVLVAGKIVTFAELGLDVFVW